MRSILIFSIIAMLFAFKRSSIFKPLINLQADGTTKKFFQSQSLWYISLEPQTLWFFVHTSS